MDCLKCQGLFINRVTLNFSLSQVNGDGDQWMFEEIALSRGSSGL